MESQTTASSGDKKTEILYGAENAVGRGVLFMANVKNRMDLCFDYRAPSIVIEVLEYKNGYADIVNRGGKIRVVTEITAENMHYCKELMKLVELRHLEGVKGGIAISESEYMATTVLEEGKPLTQVIYSNEPEVVAQGHHIFDVFWRNSIDAQQRLLELELGKEPERTEVWRDQSVIVSRSLEILNKLEKKYDFCIDSKGPSIIVTLDYIKKAYLDIVARGDKLRLITEIIPENIAYSKEIAGFAEVRHLDKIKGNFGIVDEKIYGGTASTNEKQAPASYLHSTVAEFVDQQQLFFETLWEKAIPAEECIRALEKGIPVQTTDVSYGPEKVIELSLKFLENVIHTLDLYGDSNGPAVIIAARLVHQRYLALYKTGVRIRHLVEITKDNLPHAKRMLEFSELRHLDGLKGYFAISDSRLFSSNTPASEGGVLSQFIVSSVRGLVERQQYFFNSLWEKAIPAAQRIQELEQGTEPDRLEIIKDTQKSIGRALELMNSTQKEFLILFATARTFNIALTEANKIYRDMLSRGVSIRVLIPRGGNLNEIMENVAKLAPGLDVGISDADLNTRITIMVCDRKDFMSWQLRDDSLEDPYEAGGVATYSNISSLAESYATIFDNLWKITEFAENLRIANARLEDNDQAMKDFIDIAAHELRTPIQPILGISEVLQSSTNTPSPSDQRMLIDVIVRNARRLEHVAEKILDVARMESGKLQLSLENVDLYLLTENVVRDFQKTPSSNDQNHVHDSALGGPTIEVVKEDNTVDAGGSISDRPSKETSLIAPGDAHRLEQVISNILSNATKFAGDGSIVVKIGKQRDEKSEWHGVISITDSGPGIDPEVFPKLFEKFISKSEKGLGLGLYLSKKIIETHGGKIWAKNESDGSGATFSFSLPLIDEAMQ